MKFDELLHYKPRKKKRFKRHKKGGKAKLVSDDDVDFSTSLSSVKVDENGATSDRTQKDTYHPVKCVSCNTEVAVYDIDEVYHFFNVFTSYA